MIYIQAFAVSITPIGRRRILCHKLYKTKLTLPNEFDEIDIFDPREWRYYLANIYRMPDGRPLPDKTVDGEDLVYAVYVMGVPIFIRERLMPYYITSGRPPKGRMYLFPGYDEKTGIPKRKDVYGRIRKV